MRETPSSDPSGPSATRLLYGRGSSSPRSNMPATTVAPSRAACSASSWHERPVERLGVRGEVVVGRAEVVHHALRQHDQVGRRARVRPAAGSQPRARRLARWAARVGARQPSAPSGAPWHCGVGLAGRRHRPHARTAANSGPRLPAGSRPREDATDMRAVVCDGAADPRSLTVRELPGPRRPGPGELAAARCTAAGHQPGRPDAAAGQLPAAAGRLGRARAGVRGRGARRSARASPAGRSVTRRARCCRAAATRSRWRCRPDRWSAIPDGRRLVEAGGLVEVAATVWSQRVHDRRAAARRDPAGARWRRWHRHDGDPARRSPSGPGSRSPPGRRTSWRAAPSSAPRCWSTTASRTSSSVLMDATDGHGADVVLDSLGASYLVPQPRRAGHQRPAGGHRACRAAPRPRSTCARADAQAGGRHGRHAAGASGGREGRDHGRGRRARLAAGRRRRRPAGRARRAAAGPGGARRTGSSRPARASARSS